MVKIPRFHSHNLRYPSFHVIFPLYSEHRIRISHDINGSTKLETDFIILIIIFPPSIKFHHLPFSFNFDVIYA